MPARWRNAKAARRAVIAGLWAASLVLAAAPAPAANAGSGASVEQPLTVTFSHHLGKREAVRRVKIGLEHLKRNYGGLLFAVQEETWTGEHLRFRVSVIGLAVTGSIDVADRRVDLEAFLPWLLAPLADAAVPAIRRTATGSLKGSTRAASAAKRRRRPPGDEFCHDSV